MSLLSWLKASDNDLYEDTTPDPLMLYVVVTVETTNVLGMVMEHQDKFYGEFYPFIHDNGALGIYERDTDGSVPVAYYPAGNFHSVTTMTEEEWAAAHADTAEVADND